MAGRLSSEANMALMGRIFAAFRCQGNADLV